MQRGLSEPLQEANLLGQPLTWLCVVALEWRPSGTSLSNRAPNMSVKS